VRGGDPDHGDLERGTAEAERVTGDGSQTEVPREAARFDVDGGEDEEAPHAPGGDDAALAASLLRSQAAYELPAAVSLPVNRMARMRA
jgi:hypothetical protein